MPSIQNRPSSAPRAAVAVRVLALILAGVALAGCVVVPARPYRPAYVVL
ncbi:MAG: hypothetical protein JSR21_09770 [Proteobacteria bacterium]|nr:hypothetical protein [Pseudomonadota bacterium]